MEPFSPPVLQSLLQRQILQLTSERSGPRWLGSNMNRNEMKLKNIWQIKKQKPKQVGENCCGHREVMMNQQLLWNRWSACTGWVACSPPLCPHVRHFSSHCNTASLRRKMRKYFKERCDLNLYLFSVPTHDFFFSLFKIHTAGRNEPRSGLVVALGPYVWHPWSRRNFFSDLVTKFNPLFSDSVDYIQTSVVRWFKSPGTEVRNDMNFHQRLGLERLDWWPD